MIYYDIMRYTYMYKMYRFIANDITFYDGRYYVLTPSYDFRITRNSFIWLLWTMIIIATHFL